MPFWYCIESHSVLTYLKREKEKENNKKYCMESLSAILKKREEKGEQFPPLTFIRNYS